MSRSMLSFILRKVSPLAVTFITGTTGLPMALPRPVVNTMSWQPPAALAVTDSMS